MTEVLNIKVQTNSTTEFIDISMQVIKALESSGIREGICLVYCPHTTCGLTINEAADPDVHRDMVKELNKIVPFQDNYAHAEGNSAAHIKSSLMGSSVSVPVVNGRLTFGTWQGIYLCEFDGPRHRTVLVKVIQG